MGRFASLGALAGLALALAGCESKPGAPRDGVQRVSITAGPEGFAPNEVHVVQGQPAILVFTRTTERRCVDSVVMPWREEAIELPLDQPVEVVIPDTSEAGRFSYRCWMDMLHGSVVIDPAAPNPKATP